MESGPASEQLRRLLQPRLPAQVWAYFDQGLSERPLMSAPVLAAFSGAGRRVGSSEVQLSPDELGALAARSLRLPARCSLSLLVRCFLLLTAADLLPAQAQLELVTRAYRTGGNEERCAVLHCLAALPDPARFSALAVDACRTHVLSVFEALACDNVYPARFFEEPSFNQLVVKALFMGTSLARIEGLAQRNNSELRRMVRDFVQERRAAGRTIPPDVTLIESY